MKRSKVGKANIYSLSVTIVIDTVEGCSKSDMISALKAHPHLVECELSDGYWTVEFRMRANQINTDDLKKFVENALKESIIHGYICYVNDSEEATPEFWEKSIKAFSKRIDYDKLGEGTVYEDWEHVMVVLRSEWENHPVGMGKCAVGWRYKPNGFIIPAYSKNVNERIYWAHRFAKKIVSYDERSPLIVILDKVYYE